jgi:hypothetical protein
LIAFLKDTAEIEKRMAEKSIPIRPGKQTKTWFGLEKWKEN